MDIRLRPRPRILGLVVVIAALALVVPLGAALASTRASVTSGDAQSPLLPAAQSPPPEAVRAAVEGSTHLETPDSVPNGIYTVRTDHGSRAVNAATNRLDDGAMVLSSPSGATEVKTGGMPAAFGFDQDLEAVVVSDGGQVAFTEPLPPGATIYDPGGRGSTRLVVVNLDEDAPTAELDSFQFDGNIIPEAFTSDGTALFVIEHLPPLDPTHYRVKLLDLSSGNLTVVPGPRKAPPEEDMFGTGRRQVGTSDGSFLFTLYTRQPAHHDGSAHHDHVHGFVHALHLGQRWALCIDLPVDFGQGPVGSAAITVDPADERLYVIDAHAGSIAVFDIDDVRAVNRLGSARMPAPVAILSIDVEAEAHIAAHADADSLWIAEDASIHRINVDGLTVLQKHTVDGRVESFAVGPGDRLFAVVENRLVPMRTD